METYYFGARYFAEQDWGRFEEIVADIEALRPGFIPGTPRPLHLVSRITGYRKAERVAALFRRCKRLALSLRGRRPSIAL